MRMLSKKVSYLHVGPKGALQVAEDGAFILAARHISWRVEESVQLLVVLPLSWNESSSSLIEASTPKTNFWNFESNCFERTRIQFFML
jgi:hypothetical protein